MPLAFRKLIAIGDDRILDPSTTDTNPPNKANPLYHHI